MRKTIITKTSWVFLCFDEMMMMIYNWFSVSTKSHTTTTMIAIATPQIIKCLTQMDDLHIHTATVLKTNRFYSLTNIHADVVCLGIVSFLSTVYQFHSLLTILSSRHRANRLSRNEFYAWHLYQMYNVLYALWLHDFRL